MPSDTLLAFCGRLGIQDDSVWQAERPGAYNLSEWLEARVLKVPADDEWAALVEALGDALTLRVRQDVDGVPQLEVGVSQPSASLDEGLKRIRERPDAQLLLFDLSLDKQALLERYGLAGQPFTAHFFLFSRALTTWLQKPLHEVETWLLATPYQPSVIAIADASLLRAGPMLALVGLDRLDDLTEPPACTTERRARIDNYLALARDYVAWRGPFQLTSLTPVHFELYPLQPAPDPIGCLLLDTYLHLSILYTANRSVLHAGQFEATYASSDRLVTLSLERGVDIPEAGSVLPWLARFPLDGKEREKLSVLQTVVARELPSGDPATGYEAFAQKLEPILSQADWHYRVLIEGQIGEHFEKVEKATDFVAGTTKQVSDAVDGLAKALTENLLGVVGLIAVTILATILKESVDIKLIQIALKAYAGYLFIFQFLYRMGSTFYSYILLGSETNTRQATYEAALLERTDVLFRPLRRRNVQFLLVFNLTAVLFAAVAIGLWYAADHLTAILQHFGITLVSATPTGGPP